MFPVKNNDQEYADGYGRVCNIKYRPEKNKILPTPNGKPIGKLAVYYGEIKHIHHLAIEQAGISTPFRE